MLGAITGDVIGSVYEANPIKTTNFPLFTKHSRFTDDTVLTMATALAVYLARSGHSKDKIRQVISDAFGYNLNRILKEIRPNYLFDVSCQGSVPEAILAFLESEDVESAIRLAISLGGDSDTLACIAGGVAFAFYKKIPKTIEIEVRSRLPKEFLDLLDEFSNTFMNPYG